MKVIYHIDEDTKWELVLSNITNMLNDDTHKYEIVLVANGIAVIYLTHKVASNTQLLSRLELISHRVSIEVCNNALNKYDVDIDKLLPYVKVVSAGVITIASYIHQGYAYIKP